MPITVIVATCNRPDRLAAALQAIGTALTPVTAGAAVIVADNGTQRPARDVTARFAATAGIPVHHLATPPLNKAAALNAAIAVAATDWLAFTDDDCLPDPGWLAAGAAYAARGEAKLFSGRLVAGPVDFRLPLWLRHPPHSIIDWSPAFVDYAPLPASGLLPPDTRVPFGANLFVHRDVFTRHGAYDEALWARCGAAALGCEDAEFAMRVRARGEVIGYCAEALVVHPVLPERTTLRYYLKHIYHAGVREPFFTLPGAPPPRAYLVKSMLLALVRGAGWTLRARPAHAVRELMNAGRDLGELKGWRRKG